MPDITDEMIEAGLETEPARHLGLYSDELRIIYRAMKAKEPGSGDGPSPYEVVVLTAGGEQPIVGRA